MERIIRLVLERSNLVFAALLLISVTAAWQAGNLTVKIDADGLMKSDDPQKAYYKITQETFGSDNITLVFIEAKDLFTTKKLKLLQQVTDKLETINGVTKVSSLFRLKYFKQVDGELRANPLFANIPETAYELAALRREALRDPFARKLLSSDGTATVIHIYGSADATIAGADTALVAAIEEAISTLKDDIVAFTSEERPFERVFQFGAPYVYQQLSAIALSDQSVLITLALVVLAITLVYRQRSVSGVIAPLLVVGLSILWTLGFMATMALPVNILTAIVPVLIIVLGSIQSSHMLSRFRAGLRAGYDQTGAIEYMAGTLGLAFFLTFFIILLGFASIAFNDIKVLRQFGIVAAFAWLFNFLISISVMPLFLRAFGPEQSFSQHSIIDRASESLLQIMPSKRSTVLTLYLMVSLAIGTGAIWLKINNDPLAYVDVQNPIQTRGNIIAERLHGPQNFTIVFAAETDNAFRNPVLLNEIKKVQDFIKQMKLFDTTESLADLVSLLNREAKNGDEQFYRIPPLTEFNQYLTDLLTRDDIEHFVSADFKQATLRVWHHYSTSYDLDRVVTRLREFTDTLDKRITVQFTGADILINSAMSSLLAGQVKSLLYLVIFIFALISLLFMSFKAGLIVLAPNIILAFSLFGTMGYLDIPLNIGTATIAVLAITVGLIHTVHLMIQYNVQVSEVGNEKSAMERTIRAEMSSIVVAAIALFLGFSVLAVASLKPIAHIGGLTALLMLVALVANLIVTPHLLSSMRFVTLWGIMTVNVSRQIIDNCELFKTMQPWQIKQIILMSQVREVAAGEAFIEQGAIGHEMFVILEGRARVERTAADGSQQTLVKPQAGDVIGEVALVAQEERTATVIAETDLKLLVLEWRSLEQLARFLPMISTRLFLNIARIIGTRFVHRQ